MSAEKHTVDDAWFFKHPKLKELEEAGIDNITMKKNALLVYLHLVEVQHWFNVDWYIVNEEKQVYIAGRKNEKAVKYDVILPVSVKDSLNPSCFSKMVQVVEKLPLPGDLNPGLTLALIDDNQAIFYYKLSDGLVPPKEPSARQLNQMAHIPVWNEQKGKWKY